MNSVNEYKIQSDFKTLTARFKNMDIVQAAYGRSIDLEIYYNGSWAYVELGYETKEEVDKLIKLLKKEYSINS